jgi:hypothetical protein
MEPLGIDPAIPMPKLHAITLCRLAFPVDMQIDRHYCCGITIYRLASWQMDLLPESAYTSVPTRTNDGNAPNVTGVLIGIVTTDLY